MKFYDLEINFFFILKLVLTIKEARKCIVFKYCYICKFKYCCICKEKWNEYGRMRVPSTSLVWAPFSWSGDRVEIKNKWILRPVFCVLGESIGLWNTTDMLISSIIQSFILSDLCTSEQSWNCLCHYLSLVKSYTCWAESK